MGSKGMKMKKVLLILTFWFLSVSVYSLDDSVYEVTSVRPNGNVTDAQWNSVDWNALARSIEADFVKVYPFAKQIWVSSINKVSNTITRKMLASLNDYNLEYGDMFTIGLVPYGNENSADQYFILYRHMGTKYQAQYFKILIIYK
jgi:hypothetical protein